jgi:hypothetical protein
MKDHEPTNGETSEWFTPKYIFDALRDDDGKPLVFKLDPAHPGFGTPHCVVPVCRVFTVENDGLSQSWSGLTWLNPCRF